MLPASSPCRPLAIDQCCLQAARRAMAIDGASRQGMARQRSHQKRHHNVRGHAGLQEFTEESGASAC